MIRPMTCPTCQKELPLEINGESPLFPFCSVRCKQVDLLRWMNGNYAITDQMTPEQLLEAQLQQDERIDD